MDIDLCQKHIEKGLHTWLSFVLFLIIYEHEELLSSILVEFISTSTSEALYIWNDCFILNPSSML